MIKLLHKLKLYHAIALIVLLSLCLSSCGFHLRGHVKVPRSLQRIYIQSATPYGEFEQALARNLRSYNIIVTDSANDANTVLKIISSKINQSAGAASADLQTRQYTLTYTVNFQLLAPNQDVILPKLSVYSTTTFTAQLAQMVASSSTPEEYKSSLQNEVVFRMINRLLSEDSQQSIRQYFAKQSHRK